MKTAITFLIICILFFFLASPKIQFNPFKISFDSAYHAIGIILVLFGIVFIRYQGKKDGMKEGASITLEIVQDVFKSEK